MACLFAQLLAPVKEFRQRLVWAKSIKYMRCLASLDQFLCSVVNLVILKTILHTGIVVNCYLLLCSVVKLRHPTLRCL